MKKINLTKGLFAFVDDENFEEINKFKWTATSSDGGKSFYAVRVVQKDCKIKRLYLHRIIMGAKKQDKVDHINHNKLDCTKSNLRLVTHTQNCQNMPRNKRNSSGFTGVSYCKKSNKWRSRIYVDKKEIWLGSYVKIEEAISVRIEANDKYDFHKNHGKDIKPKGRIL